MKLKCGITIEIKMGVRPSQGADPPIGPAPTALSTDLRYSFAGLVGAELDATRVVNIPVCMAPGVYEAIAWDGQGRQGRAEITVGPRAGLPTRVVLRHP